MKSYNLFLDDLRDPAICIFHKEDQQYLDFEWTVIRSHEEFVSVLKDK